MEENKSLEVFAKAPIRKAVMQNALPAMAAMLMVLVYNLADTFFIGQTHDDLQVAAVSLATPVFLLFMSVGTVFGIGGTSVISRALGEGRNDYAKKVCSFCILIVFLLRQEREPDAFCVAPPEKIDHQKIEQPKPLAERKKVPKCRQITVQVQHTFQRKS